MTKNEHEGLNDPTGITIDCIDYLLPEDRIAKFPGEKRDASKLLIYSQKQICETQFTELPSYLPDNSLLIFNNTKVVQARLLFHTSEGFQVEVFCLEPDESYADVTSAMVQTGEVKWNCMVGNLKRWKQHQLTLTMPGVQLCAEKGKHENGVVSVLFTWNDKTLSFAEILDRSGVLPIPPYLKRETTAIDKERYQTIYASEKGSVAAPTAGLHFTEPVFEKLSEKNIAHTYVTLHVGAGTFKPVKSTTIGEHLMHSEWIEVETETITCLLTDQPVIAVGTTSLRTLETLYWMGVKATLNPDAGLKELEITQWDAYHLPDDIDKKTSLTALLNWVRKQGAGKLICKTSLMIAPPYRLKIAKGIITNFHQPKSTLLLIISAIVGQEWRRIYDYALSHNFRFLSYGDSSLLMAD